MMVSPTDNRQGSVSFVDLSLDELGYTIRQSLLHQHLAAAAAATINYLFDTTPPLIRQLIFHMKLSGLMAQKRPTWNKQHGFKFAHV